VEAGRRTIDSTAREVAELVTHRITSTYTPDIELLIDEHKVGSVRFRLDLTFDIVGCTAAVASGDLVAIEGGKVKVTGTVTMGSTTLLKKSKQLDLHVLVNLRRPVPLTRAASAPNRAGDGPVRRAG
jgi:hypothetical protein